MYTIVAAMRKGLVMDISMNVKDMLTMIRPFVIGQLV